MRLVTTVFLIMCASVSLQSQQAIPFQPGNITVSPGNVLLTPLAGQSAGTAWETSATTANLPDSRDTLRDHLVRSSRFVVYSYSVSGNTYPLIGSNTLYVFIGQKFPFTGSATLHGILFACNQKRITDPPDTLGANFFPGSATTGLPSGTSVAFGTFTMDNVDTNRITPTFTYVPMNTNPTVTGPFVATVQTRRGSSHDDLFVIFSNQQGDGRGERRACYITIQNNQLLSGDVAALPFNIGGATLDLDIMILPVIEPAVTGTDAPGAAIDGIELRGLSPQPASTLATLALRCTEPARITLDLIDMRGAVISHGPTRELTPGQHALSIPVATLASGTYFLRVGHDKGAVALPLRIAR